MLIKLSDCVECEIHRIATFSGEAEVLSDVLEDVLRSFVDVRIVITHTVLAVHSLRVPNRAWLFSHVHLHTLV